MASYYADLTTYKQRKATNLVSSKNISRISLGVQRIIAYCTLIYAKICIFKGEQLYLSLNEKKRVNSITHKLPHLKRIQSFDTLWQNSQNPSQISYWEELDIPLRVKEHPGGQMVTQACHATGPWFDSSWWPLLHFIPCLFSHVSCLPTYFYYQIKAKCPKITFLEKDRESIIMAPPGD